MQFDISVSNLRIRREGRAYPVNWENADNVQFSASADCEVVLNGEVFDFPDIAPMHFIRDIIGAIYEIDLFPHAASDGFSFPDWHISWRLSRQADDYVVETVLLKDPIKVPQDHFRKVVYAIYEQLAGFYRRAYPTDPEILTITHSLIVLRPPHTLIPRTYRSPGPPRTVPGFSPPWPSGLPGDTGSKGGDPT